MMISRGGGLIMLASSSSSHAPVVHNKISCTTTTTTTASNGHGRLTRRRTSTLFALAAAVVVVAPPHLSAQAASSTTTTPYSQSRTLQLGLDANGKIRTCPSTNPGCVCTNPTVGASSSVASPLLIPDAVASAEAAAELLRQAIVKTQKNVSFFLFKEEEEEEEEEEEAGLHRRSSKYIYIQAEVDGGGFLGRRGRDVMEFLVNMDAGVVAYRCVAKEVTFVYPFTTAVGDSRGQEQRVAAIAQELGWYAPDVTSSLDADAN